MGGGNFDYHQMAVDYVSDPMGSGKSPLSRGGYMAIKTAPGRDAGFVQISPIDGPPENGWKFHISTDIRDHKKAWNIIAPHVIEHNLHAKFAIGSTLENMGNENYDRRGRAITLYATDNADLRPIVHAINADLEKAGIRPGHAPMVDRKLTGSPYMSYRNDYDHQGNYMDAKSLMHLPEDQRYNPVGKADPYHDLDVRKPIPLPKKSFISKEAGEVLSAQKPIHTNRGIYLSVEDMTPNDAKKLKDTLKSAGISFQEKTSSLNGGMKVLALNEDGGAKLFKVISDIGVHQEARKILSEQTPIHTNRGVYLPVDKMPPEEFSKLKDSLRHEGISFQEKTSSLNGGMRVLALDEEGNSTFRRILDDYHRKTPSTPHYSPASHSGAGQKIDKATGHASTAFNAATHLAKGDVAGAGVVVATDIGTGMVVKQLAKRIPVVGAVVTAATALWSAGSQAADGNFGKATAELAAGGAEAAGNIVGFGAGDAAREVVRGAISSAAGDKYAPEKSGLRQMAENAYELGSKAVQDSRYKSMSKSELAKFIQQDDILPDKVKLNGRNVNLSTALEDKGFRTNMINNLEAAVAKGNDLSQQISMIKAFGEKLDAHSSNTSRMSTTQDFTIIAP